MRIHTSLAAISVWVLCAFMSTVVASPASATTAGTGWDVFASAFPTHLEPGGEGNIQVDFVNVGAVRSEGSITVTDTLPPGVTATKAGGMAVPAAILSPAEEEASTIGDRWICTGNGSGERSVEGATITTCTSNPTFLRLPVAGFERKEESPAERIGIAVKVEAGASSGTNRATVAGGGASNATMTSNPVTVSSSQPEFGFSGWDVMLSNADGTPDTQAGSHPYDATFIFGSNELTKESSGGKIAGGELRNVAVDVPPGFFGEPNAVPQCTRSQLDGNNCPPQTQVGVDAVGFYAENGHHGTSSFQPLGVYNMVPPPGVPVEFAFSVAGFHTFFDAGVRSGNGYGIVEHVDNIVRAEFDVNVLTIWGVPPDASHDVQRGRFGYCESEEEGGCSSGVVPRPFLTLPTSCAGPQPFVMHALSSWTNEDAKAEATVLTHDDNGVPTGFTGCEHLTVEPSLSVSPDTSFADTPAGLTVDLKVPQEALRLPEGLVAATLKNTTVTLPEGVVINPGQAAGLAACQEAEANVHGEGPATCPNASKVGTVRIKTPLLEGTLESELEGNVYVLQSNPPNLQLLLTAYADGVYLKLVGNVHLDESTGRLTTTFTETPELPFTDLKLSFSGGAQAALATPTTCGTYTTTGDFTPWTSPFAADSLVSTSFQITGGTNGAPCPSSPLPFTPSLIAGSSTDQAGGFTNFSMLLQAPDDQQRISGLQFKVPQGLLGMISKVPLCPEQQAAEGTCSAASQIGHTVVASGPGPYPLVVPQPGQPPAPIYLTGPYKDAPYGLSIVVPLHVGPFTLQTQVVRAKIEVDPLTAQITVTTDPLPQVIDGIPTDLRTVNAVIDRPEFMFNPTNCSPMSFSGTAYSVQGGSAPISTPFQMGSCRALLFKPNFTVSTSGHTSRKDGASLEAKIVYPTGNLGANQASSQSNIHSVKVDLPKQLPSRLTTLQKACTSQTFEANPASCPVDSRVGTVSAVTPVLPVPLTGPAYFVSYGGAKFPELVFALQGYGVTVYLHGETFINKAGITSSTFRTVPDVPISLFDLKLPEGPFSALAANGNLCKSSLKMPTSFTAQDGATIKQSTPISVTGCAKHKAKARKVRKRSGAAHGGPKRATKKR
jgi:hypothetical protein